uniref:Protease m50 membrane-bound transcription factor site 2 protease n=1 Tax=Solanum tuberosum TaxID=4113 RepID=M1BEW9_SOLTU
MEGNKDPHSDSDSQKFLYLKTFGEPTSGSQPRVRRLQFLRQAPLLGQLRWRSLIPGRIELNRKLCAVCAWALFLQPLILYPLYIHDEGPMVLEVSPTSPLSGHLSPGDVIISLDDFRINNAQEWSQIIDVLTERSYQTFQNHSLLENSMKRSIGKGYCIPYSLVEEGKRVSLKGNRTCPDELSAFITIPCSDQAMLDDDSLEVNHQRDGGVFHCFYDKDVLKLEKCGDGWGRLHSNRSSCLCSKEGACFLPLLSTGVAWVEITYSIPSPLQCSHLGRTRVIDDNNSRENPCVKTFVFVGDAISIKHSVLLTSYQPRWSAKFGAHLPYVLERLLMFTFHVSMTLALLNSLPVYFLDGEAISEDEIIAEMKFRQYGLLIGNCCSDSDILMAKVEPFKSKRKEDVSISMVKPLAFYLGDCKT